ncbi:glycosyltransferase [Photobacterium leiognathi]|uniref:glycosyltransferase n=1 Tax=Photobacterium leiognathi TaxID=553611 RepID=UPI001EDEC404|nr:glycosyltransferase [Photobacterium leiognathi]MCG3886881.1 glycosyltransferase [Photobacterium leiognathi]
MNIAAIIVTYNRSDKLYNSVDSLFKKTIEPKYVVIVDNNSTDNTQDVIKCLENKYPQVKSIKTKRNIGGAGGFCVGLKYAYELGSSHFWIMDDDSYATDNSLSKLIKGYNELSELHKVGFLCSRVNWIDNNICEMNQPEPVWNWMRCFSADMQAIQVQSCSFVSCFFSREVLEEHGLPLDEFFIWFDDAEFTKRIARHYPCFCILDSIVIHDTPVNKGVYFALVNDNNLWKFSYGAKNESWYKFKKESPLHWLIYIIEKNYQMHQGSVSIKNRFKINIKFIEGVFSRRRIKSVKDFDLSNYL